MDASGVGHVALTAAVVLSAVTVLDAVVAKGRHRCVLAASAATAAVVATAVLARALVRLDLSLVYVADAARRDASRPYRLAGLWAGMAGSLLLWSTLLSAVAALSTLAASRRRPDLATTHAAVAVAVAGTTLAVSRWAADPFRRLAIPAIDGGGLVPILEHGAMLVHPPLVYLGLTAILAPFAFTVAALAHRRLDDAWATVVRRWTVWSWAALLAAMAIGAHWAYEELAWGGFWAWDPVENGVLLPWLVLTAALHGAQRSRPRLHAGLVLASFLLAGLGGALTRSGATASVHAFAEARRVGVALGVAGALLTLGAALVWLRGRPTRATGTDRLLLRVNTAALVAIVTVVLVGTVAPVVLAWFDDRRRVVAPSFFSRLTWPFAVVLLLAVGGSTANPRRTTHVGAAVLGALGALVVLTLGGTPAVAVLAGAAVFAAASTVASAASRRRPLGAELAHLGLAVVIVGVAGTTLGTDATVPVAQGTSYSVRGYRLRVGEFTTARRATSVDVRVPVEVRRDGHLVTTLQPAWRVAQPSGLAVAVAATRSTFVDDLQVVLARVAPPASAVLVVRVRPLASWLWWGSAVMAAGGVLAALRRPRRSAAVATGPLAGQQLPERVDLGQ